jgi:hypothetical protein
MINRKYNTTLHDSKEDEEGTDVEVTEYPHFDDNLELAGSTNKLVDSKTGRFIAIIDFNGDYGKIRECPHCLQYEIHNKLQPRILKKGEVKPPDYDEFIQCYSCGNIFPIYEAHYESEIKDSLETTDNPFENESTFLSTESRVEQRRKGKSPRSKRFNTEEHEDAEIQTEIKKGNIVNLLYDSNH